jgi:hypothetical protein
MAASELANKLSGRKPSDAIAVPLGVEIQRPDQAERPVLYGRRRVCARRVRILTRELGALGPRDARRTDFG